MEKTQMEISYYSEKMRQIKNDRHPINRHDQRDWNTLIFWSTQLVPTRIIYFQAGMNIHDNIQLFKEFIINHRTPNGTHKYIKTFKTKHSLQFQIIHSSKETISLHHTIKYENIKYLTHTDNRNNTYYICINENTTNFNTSEQAIKSLRDTAKLLKLSKSTFLRAVFLSEIFTCLAIQLWHSINHNTKHFIDKFIEITAVSAAFIKQSGLLYDPIFLSMTGHLGEYRDEFNKIPITCRELTIQNKNLYFDCYFNINNSKKNFISRNYSYEFFKTIVTYFNDSCITDPFIEKDEWIKNISKQQYKLNKVALGYIVGRYIFYNYGFFIIKAPKHIQYLMGVIPKEMGRIYITHYDITPQEFIVNILNNTIYTVRDVSLQTESDIIKKIFKQLKYLKIEGITK